MQASSNVSTLVFPRKPHIKNFAYPPTNLDALFRLVPLWMTASMTVPDLRSVMAQPSGKLLMTCLNSYSNGATRGLAQGLLWTLDNDALPTSQIPHPSGCYLPREMGQQRVDV
jgi:hypothetical protein